MNALERKFSNMVYDFRHSTPENREPKYLSATIRWNDDKVYVKNTIFLLNGDYECENDTIFYIVPEPNQLFSLLANIDFIRDDFYCMDDFMQEVDKYDTDDPDSLDWTYLHRGEDFCIVDIEEVW